MMKEQDAVRDIIFFLIGHQSAKRKKSKINKKKASEPI